LKGKINRLPRAAKPQENPAGKRPAWDLYRRTEVPRQPKPILRPILALAPKSAGRL